MKEAENRKVVVMSITKHGQSCKLKRQGARRKDPSWLFCYTHYQKQNNARTAPNVSISPLLKEVKLHSLFFLCCLF
jgi:hypothetical protein